MDKLFIEAKRNLNFEDIQSIRRYISIYLRVYPQNKRLIKAINNYIVWPNLPTMAKVIESIEIKFEEDYEFLQECLKVIFEKCIKEGAISNEGYSIDRVYEQKKIEGVDEWPYRLALRFDHIILYPKKLSLFWKRIAKVANG